MTDHKRILILSYLESLKYWTDRLATDPDNAFAWSALSGLIREAIEDLSDIESGDRIARGTN